MCGNIWKCVEVETHQQSVLLALWCRLHPPLYTHTLTLSLIVLMMRSLWLWAVMLVAQTHKKAWIWIKINSQAQHVKWNRLVCSSASSCAFSVWTCRHSRPVSFPLCCIDLVRGMLSCPVIDSQLAPLGSAESPFLSACCTLKLSTCCLCSEPFPSSSSVSRQPSFLSDVKLCFILLQKKDHRKRKVYLKVETWHDVNQIKLHQAVPLYFLWIYCS